MLKKKIIGLDPERLNELLGQMPEEARELFLLQCWLDQFDEECPVDMILSNIILEILGNVGSALIEDIENTISKAEKEKGKKAYCIYDGMKIAIKELKKMTIELEEKLQTLINIDNEDIKH